MRRDKRIYNFELKKKFLNSLENMKQVSMINIEEMDIHQANIQFINLFLKISKMLQTVLLP